MHKKRLQFSAHVSARQARFDSTARAPRNARLRVNNFRSSGGLAQRVRGRRGPMTGSGVIRRFNCGVGGVRFSNPPWEPRTSHGAGTVSAQPSPWILHGSHDRRLLRFQVTLRLLRQLSNPAGLVCAALPGHIALAACLH